jgi:NAD(P)H dehydrogenase (quinone)
MKHAIIVAHPNADSFSLTMARAHQSAAERLGAVTILRDLYRINFDPRLSDAEIPRPSGFAPAEDVKVERSLIGDADVFVFVYPLWFNAPPAMLKGYIDRVFGMDFGFGPAAGATEPLLRGRRMTSISSSGAPKDWVVESGALGALRKLFDEHVSAMCGLRVLDHIHFGGITPEITVEAVERCVSEVDHTVEKYFGDAAAPGASTQPSS